MKAISLRFSEIIAPTGGTIKAHENILNRYGYVWYGKMGNPVSEKTIADCFHDGVIKLLLVQGGKNGRWWAYCDQIQRSVPEKECIPDYYREKTEYFKTWFRIVKFEIAPSNVLSKCIVVSSGKSLSTALMQNLGSYFVVDFFE